MKATASAAMNPAKIARGQRLRRFAALLRKESYQIIRDPSSMLIALVLPLILLFLFGYAVSLDATRTKIGVAIEAATPAARNLAASFQASRYFDVRLGRDRREFANDLVLGAVKGIVVIPATFTADQRRRGDPTQIQVIVDGSDPNMASFVQNYAQGVLASWASLTAADGGTAATPISVEPPTQPRCRSSSTARTPTRRASCRIMRRACSRAGRASPPPRAA